MHKAPRFAPVVVFIVLLGVFSIFLANRASGKSNELASTGTIEAQEVIISPELAGRVVVVSFEEGDRVEAGASLISFDASLITAQQSQAEAGLLAAQAGSRAAQANLELLLAGPSDEQLRVAQAGVKQARVNLDAAQEAFDDLPEYQQELAAGKGLQQQIDRAQAALESAQAQFELVRAGARDEQIEAAREQAAAASAQAESADAALALLAVQRSKLSLSSPIAGTVLERNIQPGEFAAPGSVLLVLGRTDELVLTVYIPEDRIGLIRMGQPVDVWVDSYPDEVFHGQVTHIADQAEFTPRNVQTSASRKTTVFAVRLALGDGGGKLKPGMPADVMFR